MVNHYKTNNPTRTICDKCEFHCNLIEGEIGLCGRILLKHSKPSQISMNKIYFSRGVNIETVHLFHFWPGNKIDVLLTNPDNSRRYPFLELSSIHIKLDKEVNQLREILWTNTRSSSESIGVFIGGFEPLMFKEFFDSIIKMYSRDKLVITETFLALNLNMYESALSNINAIVLNFPIHGQDKSILPYVYPTNIKLVRFIEKLENLDIHFEVNLIVIRDIATNLSKLKELKLIYGAVSTETPIHIIRPRHMASLGNIYISNRTLERVRNHLIEIGYRYVYVDDLYISQKNKTPLGWDGKSCIERYGPWTKIRDQKTDTSPTKIIGKIKETYPL